MNSGKTIFAQLMDFVPPDALSGSKNTGPSRSRSLRH